MARTYFAGFTFFAALCITASGQTLPMLHGRGGEWLSWTPVQRTAYVQGFGLMGTCLVLTVRAIWRTSYLKSASPIA